MKTLQMSMQLTWRNASCDDNLFKDSGHADNYSKITAPAKKLPSFGLGRLLFAVILAVILFLLGQSMVRHNFHQGQRVRRDFSTGQ